MMILFIKVSSGAAGDIIAKTLPFLNNPHAQVRLAAGCPFSSLEPHSKKKTFEGTAAFRMRADHQDTLR